MAVRVSNSFVGVEGFKAFGLGFREVQESRFRFSKDFQGLKALDKSEGGFARAWVRFLITEVWILRSDEHEIDSFRGFEMI